MKRKYKEPCYYCGGAACSNEHAPPKQMFKGFCCDSITVPACEKHNSSKGGNDQAIVSMFLIPLYNGRETYDLEDEILRAIELAEGAFPRTKRRAINSPLFNDAPEEFKDLPNVAYLIPDVDIKGWVRQLTAALLYDAIQSIDSTIKWNEAISWSPDWVEASDPTAVTFEETVSTLIKKQITQLQLEQFSWANGWSAYPRPYPTSIYCFQIHFESNEIIFKHKFYNRYNWYVWLPATQETMSKLNDKLSS